MKEYNYNYNLPKELIANEPANPRDSSKLLIVDTKNDKIIFDTFNNFYKYIPENSLIILNNTKVVPARVNMYKETGGKLEVFFLANEIKDKNKIPVIVDRKIELGRFLFAENFEVNLAKPNLPQKIFKIISQEENKFYLQPVLESGEINLNFDLNIFLEKYGKMPVPKYIKNVEANFKEKYQTIFAKEGNSVAAPTASLHFTEKTFKDLKNKNIKVEYLKLDVGFGTFITPTEENIKLGKIHTEPVLISKQTIENIINAKKENKKIVAVGTTVVRSLESYAIKKELSFDTDIFIKPPYNFIFPDIILTNFHLPNTSLMMLVQAFLEYKGSKLELVEIYKIAIENKFRFYSLGDAMLIV